MERYLIVGGSSGIGAASADVIMARGGAVTIMDVTPPSRPGTEYIPVDVSDADSIREAMARVREPLAGWLHTAGISLSSPIEEMPDGDIARQVAVNLTGMCLTAKYVSRHLAEGAAVVLVASELAMVGTTRGGIVYSATKGGVVALARSLAVSWRNRNIRVNALCPGATRTPMIEASWARENDAGRAEREDAAGAVLNRVAEPEEIARAAWFLLSSDSSFVDGHTLVADGGAIIW
ncbi:MAG: SDR family NAD(P)-dependent oxidoreductase [Clostridia bacterium]